MKRTAREIWSDIEQDRINHRQMMEARQEQAKQTGICMYAHESFINRNAVRGCDGCGELLCDSCGYILNGFNYCNACWELEK